MAKLTSINPSNYKVLEEIDVSTGFDIAVKVGGARKKAKEWTELTIANRVQILRQAVAEFEKRKEECALLESREMGMPISEAKVDLDTTLAFANWYLDNAEKILAPETTFESGTEIHQVYHEPFGVMAVILPWNYPFLLFVWDVFPGLISGNTVVMKHSEETPLCGRFIEEVMARYLPQGVFSEVYGDGSVGQCLVRQDIDLLAFTGSTKTGQRLYRELAKKNKFIRTVMELGGSAPGIVFDDANIDAAVRSICEFRLSNCGQYCDGLKRLIVHKNVFYEVVGKLSEAFEARKIGAAEDANTQLGPLAAKRQLDLIVRQVEDAKTKKARVITGGNSLELHLGGAFYQPTILTNVTNDMRVWKEEVFGPVLPVMSFETEEEAINLANDTTYGLGSYVYTADMERARRAAAKIQSGMVSVNGTNYTTPFNPFGGKKSSGIGREHGKWGFHEVTQVKVVARNK